tara:strand:- start:582 stop:1307 length:726 start_codon:yes stop_codon:yes gene_type:complete
MTAFKNILMSFKMIMGDKVLLILSLIPVTIGLLFYGLLGGWIFTSIIPFGNELIQTWLSIDWLGSILGWIAKALITILFFFVINWTFFLVVSLLASPFNDLISARVERKLLNQDLGTLGASFDGVFKKIGFTLINESKKVFLIMILSLISLLLSFFPILSPVTILVQSILVAVNFLDYNWSRHDLNIKECFRSYKLSFVDNTISGLIGVGVLAIPGLNILSLPVLIVAFSIQFTEKLNSSR